MKEIFKGIFSFVLLSSCAQFICAQEALEVSSENIPSSLKAETSLKLTGEWDTYAFTQLKTALGTNAFGGNNTTLSKVDMSSAQIAENTSLYVSSGFSSNGAFMNCKALTEIVMPIAEEAAQFTSFQGAFQNCDKLTTIDLSGCTNVTTFNNAFYGCASLTQADLKNNVAATKTSSWTSAFEGCSALAQVSLPAGFAPTNKVFANCTALNEIDWSACNATETVPTYYAGLFEGVDVSGITLKLNHAQYLLFKGDENWSQLNLVDLTPEPSTEYTVDASDIPSSLQKATAVTLTGEWDSDKFNLLSLALGNNGGILATPNITLLTLDMSQITVAEGTPLYRKGLKEYGIFNNCTALTQVIMPTAAEAAKFTDLTLAFSGCTALKNIDLSQCSGITSLSKAFYNCSALTSVNLSACTALTVTDNAFENCESLTSVVLPASFPIGKNTFAYCNALKEIDWTSFSATEIPELGKTFFMGIDDLSLIKLSLKYEAYKLFSADADWSELNLYNTEPEKVTDFVVDASDIPSSLSKAVTLTLTGVWDSDKLNLLSLALGNNGGLFDVYNKTLTKLDMSQITVAEDTPLSRQGINKEYGIFNNCTALTDVVLPAAEECAKFTSLKKAFKGCTALVNIDLKLFTGATDIDEAFMNTAITTADLSGYATVGTTVSAFEGCSALESVVLPENFQAGNYTFADCTALKTIDFTAYTNTEEVPACSNNTFSGIDDLSLITLKVGQNTSVFEQHKIWSQFHLDGEASTGISQTESNAAPVKVYTIDGQYVGTYMMNERLLSELPRPGIYVIQGKKYFKNR